MKSSQTAESHHFRRFVVIGGIALSCYDIHRSFYKEFHER